MKLIIRLEELSKLLAAYIFTILLGYSWWWFWALILLPDLSMVGYLVNTRVGAILYNLVHHQGIALAIIFFGYITHSSPAMLAGVVLFGHSSLDRVFGYGLKYPDSFQHNHLGQIGRK